MRDGHYNDDKGGEERLREMGQLLYIRGRSTRHSVHNDIDDSSDMRNAQSGREIFSTESSSSRHSNSL